MAGFTGCRELGCHVVGIRGRIVICQMATHTRGWNAGIPVCMTTDTGNSDMGTGQWKSSCRRMVECRRAPRIYIMTGLAIG